MSRIGLIGENSKEFVEKVIDIWNENNSVVLIDWRIPLKKAYEMLREAEAVFCHVDSQILISQNADYEDGFYKPYIVDQMNEYSLVPKEVLDKYQKCYDKKEAIVLFSSGTTGKCKGIRLSHFSITSNADAVIKYMEIGNQDCICIVKALTHSATFVDELLVGMISGANIVLGPTIVTPRAIMRNVAKYHISYICLNPTLLNIYTKVMKREEYNLSSLKKMYISGAVIDQSILEEGRRNFPSVGLFNVYGLSEAGPRVSAQREGCAHGSSVGKPIDGVEIVIGKDNGTELGVNERGMIYVKTPYHYDGYISGEKKMIHDGGEWIVTGDVGYLDEHGELHVVDRADDLIILDSHKIYPSDVEQMIKTTTSIDECVVVKCMKKMGEGYLIVCFYVGEQDITNDQLEELKNKLAAYEIPRRFIHINEIPKTTNGKINRKALVNDFENERKNQTWNS